ncbi:putative phosphoglycerate mutase [Arcanobacterium wilhelmae]|uniref:Phosphoglycerate mutase n=1 Tax=Arcanobacterium wilhelmae TaxID=1803177 RepID=A0ABT9ND54_9ACTO|nr:histidine phosphatase family protein [Arcanobacterium wilhelmae]MDP9801650.1 putative phosphoglycerate mutase [Arcanobacterium wilhelmae]WFN90971.1 histidine phosphatase family protein [Arcanobacterium wilhelmae]
MSASTVILWRHGQTDFNKLRRIQGASDIALNATGIAQAQRAAKQLVKLGIDQIVVSDLGRAQATADAAAKRLGVTPVVDSRLRERGYGLWEGKTSEEIQELWPSEWATWRTGADPVGVGVERRDDAGARFAQAVTEHANAAPDGSTLLVVAHGGIISCGIVSLFGGHPSSFYPLVVLDNCHWAVLKAGQVEGSWRLRSYNRMLAHSEDVDLIPEIIG